MNERQQLNQEKSGVYRRAASIRRQWSMGERTRRLGLPPDMPARLQTRLTGRPERSW